MRSELRALFKGKELCTTMNPDECVAHGAAVVAEQLINGSDSMKLWDISSLSISIGSLDRQSNEMLAEVREAARAGKAQLALCWRCLSPHLLLPLSCVWLRR